MKNNKILKATLFYRLKSFLPKRFLTALFAMMVVMTSCDNFVEVDLPSDQLLAQNVFTEPTTANAAMVEVYSKIRDGGLFSGIRNGVPFTLANYTDEMDFYGSSSIETFDFYTNSLSAETPSVQNFWDKSYNQIYGANAIIEGVEQSDALLPELKNQLTGESLFVRGLLHFTLANIYGGVPYITSTDYQVNKNVSRNSISEVYQLAKKDIEDAILLLPDAYVIANRTRPNRSAAQALLARICLYAGSWDEASNAASAVLNETALYGNSTALSGIFLKNSGSTIWQLSPTKNTGSTIEAATYLFESGPPPLSAVSTSLLSAFEPTALRKTLWLKEITTGGSSWFHPYKYKEGKNSTSGLEHSILFRTAEMYLIRAEARTRSGFLTGGIEDLNVIRLKAGLPPSTATTSEALLNAILQERRIEFFCELGHRFYDLKRFGLLDEVLAGVKPGWSTTDALFPIPANELNLNRQLEPQNPGY
jgi:hypothetical protein